MTQKNNEPSVEQSFEQAMGRTETFIENHGKSLTLGLILILLVGGIWIGYVKLVSEPRAEKASALLAQAQERFAAADADYELALTGDDAATGFLEVIERYGSTPAGNLANHYAGVCYAKLGRIDEALKYLGRYRAADGIPAQLVNAQNYGLQADLLVDADRLKTAVKFYDKAIAASDNLLTAPVYLRKAALALKALGDKKKAEEYLRRIETLYPASYEAREVEKMIQSL